VHAGGHYLHAGLQPLADQGVAALQALQSFARPGAPLVVECGQLIRIDFAAVGGVLNWAATQQAAGQELEFRRLHRLVAVFFNVIGVNEHAWIVPRQD